MTVAPARTIGDIPPDYHGPIYYRLQRIWRRPQRMVQEFIRIEQDGRGKRPQDSLARRLGGLDRHAAALRIEPKLFDEGGNLLPEWRGPLKAKLLADAPKTWPEFGGGIITYVSERFRDVVEREEPSTHTFIPLDVSGAGRSTFRMYVFFCGNAVRRTAIAMRANSIAYRLSERGTPIFSVPEWMETTSQFAYLNNEVIGESELFYDVRAGLIFSDNLVRALGDVLPSDTTFIAMGAVNESLESLK